MSGAVYLIIFIALMVIAVGGVFFAVVRPWAPWYHKKSVSEKKPFQPDLGMKVREDTGCAAEDAGKAAGLRSEGAAASAVPRAGDEIAEESDADGETDDELYQSFYGEDEEDDG